MGPDFKHARGVGARLVTEFDALCEDHATLIEHRQRAWASVTFSGTRHELAFAFEGAEAVGAGETLIDRAPDHEFAIPGHLVADVAVVEVEHAMLPEPRMTVRLEVLTLEDG